jgi:hypothetical protein
LFPINRGTGENLVKHPSSKLHAPLVGLSLLSAFISTALNAAVVPIRIRKSLDSVDNLLSSQNNFNPD